MSGFLNTKIAQERLVASVTNASEDTTLVGSGTNLTDEYRIENLTDNQIKLQDFTNGAFLHMNAGADAETGTVELWAYPEKGDAEFYGIFTYTADEMVDGEGRFYIDAFVLGTAGQHPVTILNMSDGKAVLKFDARGFAYIVALVTAITGAAGSVHKVYLRPW